MFQVSPIDKFAPFNRVFSDALRQKLGLLLDLDEEEGRNYVMLAEKIGMETDKIHWISQRKGGPHGPTELVLREFEAQGKTMQDFKLLMTEMGRLDVLDEIAKSEKPS